ncbi:MAG: phosphoglucosamine mutase [Coxiella sp. RIFCSPHIGHO2_12_FULL_44_14]|nr:MAG: phosphoglucosamine mutase [Coxiella sp. RIFCSPHIGHO2_12_FULL_44_14]
MRVQKKYFGTDGIRGQVGKSLINAEFMLKLGWAVGTALVQQGPATVLIGKDTRISGYMIESALQAGLSAAGADTKLLGPMPTPAIAYLTHSIRASAGIVISASHNAYPDNGIKFFDQEGFKLSDELELTIEELVDRPMQTVSAERLGKAMRIVDAQGRYIEFCKSTFPSHLTLKGLKIVVDCANGAAYYVAPSIFHELGATVVATADQPDGFNINQSCGATDTRHLQKIVVQQGADLGIALDGDGDRVMMVDHRGALVDGDELLCILAKDHLMDPHQGFGVVGTVMSNLGLQQALEQCGIAFERAPVGDRHVLEKLQSKGWRLGGESSGHIVDLNYTTTGDGIITALQILRILQTQGKTLADLKNVMVKCPQVLINVPVFGTVDIHQYPKIKTAVLQAENKLNGKGRVLLRPSGTESVIRVMVEGQDEGLVRETAEQLAAVVEKSIAG